MSDTSNFVADPLSFMKNNIVQQTASSVVGLVGDFALTPNGPTGITPDGKNCNVFSITKGSKSGESFKSYWCPYSDDKVHSITLGSESNLMLTAKMDGCSFGVGIPSSDGSVMVAHSNFSTSEVLDKIQSEMMESAFSKDQDAIAKMKFLEAKKSSTRQAGQHAMLESSDGVGSLSSELSPALYRTLRVTTFGIRDKLGKWSFYFQGYTQNGPNLEMFGVFPFPKKP